MKISKPFRLAFQAAATFEGFALAQEPEGVHICSLPGNQKTWVLSSVFAATFLGDKKDGHLLRFQYSRLIRFHFAYSRFIRFNFVHFRFIRFKSSFGNIGKLK